MRSCSLRVTSLVLLIASLHCLPSVAQQSSGAVYKWSDSHGGVHYTDCPPPSDGKLISIDNHVASPSPPTRSAPAAASDGASSAAPKANPDPRLKSAVDADVSAANAEQCNKAQERYQNLIRARRLFKNGSGNERVYLSSDEIDQERMDAKHDVDFYCSKDDTP